MPGRSDVDLQIRKLRKKLRQIEHLERLEFEDRDLTEDEERKVANKPELRARLQELLLEFSEELELSGYTVSSFGEDVSELSVEPSDDSYLAAETGFTEEPAELSPHLTGQLQVDDYNGHSCIPAEEILSTETESTEIEMAEDEWQTVKKKTSPARTNSKEPSKSKKTVVSPPVAVAVTTRRKEEVTQKVIEKKEKMPEPAQKRQKRETKVENPGMTAEEKELKEHRRTWANMKFHVLTLEGHNDLVCSVYVSQRCLLSGSRDTTVKVWDIQTGQELRSLGSHTGTVTAVFLVSPIASKSLCEGYELLDDDQIVLSASQDCSLKLWSLHTGKMVRSMYTYNPVTAVTFMDTPRLIVAGSGGGKIELWSAETGECIQSVIAHEDAITSVQVDGSFVYSSGADGIIKVYQFRERALHLMHSSDDVNNDDKSPLVQRHIRSMATANQKVYFGDDGLNVKVLDWKKGIIHKLRNHTGEFGSTDAMCCYGNELLTSAYDLDTGRGYINVRSLSDEKYLASLHDESVTRIMCMSCDRSRSNQLVVATGGFDLKLWIQQDRHSIETEDVVRPVYVASYDRAARHSDAESDGDVTESEPEDSGIRFWRSTTRRRHGSGEDEQSARGWMSWCQLL